MRYTRQIKWSWHYGFGYICRVLLYLMYLLSLLTPRNKNIWIFGSWQGGKFADNSKYLFLYVKREHPEIRAIWLTHNTGVVNELSREGYEVYRIKSLKGFLYSLVAGYVFVSGSMSDVNVYAIGGAKKVHLFHATVIKKGVSDDKLKANEARRKQNMSWLDKVRVCFEKKLTPPLQYDMFVATSEASAVNLSDAFKVSRNLVRITGYPRNDVLLGATYQGINKCDYLENIRNRVEFREVYAYLPTFRDAVRQGLDLFGKYHFVVEEVQRFLERRNAVLIIKGHRADRRMNLLGTIAETDRIHHPTDDELPDVQLLLREADILITDYSSVYLDYLLLNRPVIFIPFDFDFYLKECRELYYNYDEITPGPKAKDWREVFSLIEEALREDYWQQEREIVCSYFNRFRDGESSARVFNLVVKE